MKAIEKISLYYAEGHSDKEYHCRNRRSRQGNVVNFRDGRRGAH